MLNFRPSAGANVGQSFYSPARDVAHVGPYWVSLAMELLEPENRDESFSKFLAENDVTEDELAKAVNAFADVLSRVHLASTWQEACKAVDFYGHRQAVLSAILGRLGHVVMVAMWKGLNENYIAGNAPAKSTQSVIDQIHDSFKATE